MENVTPQPVPEHWAVRFFTIWTGQAFSLFGSQLVQFALVWYLTLKTGSATILATATLAAMLPQIVLGPFAGAIVDRSSRRLIMVLADSFIAFTTFGLIVLFATGKIQTWHIYAAMALRSLGNAFQSPAMSASTPLMVPEKYLTRVSGMNQTLQGIMSMIAPPAGALLITVLPTQSVLMIDVVTAALAVLPLLFISIPQPIKKKVESMEKTSLLHDIREAFIYIRAWPGLMAILFMALIINFLLTPTGSLMPLLVTKYFGKGALEYGLTDTAFGFGFVAGGLLLSIWGGFKRKVATSLTGIVGIGVGVLMVGLAPATAFPLALAGMAFIGVTNPLANGPLSALVQTVVRPDMQGRVTSLIMSAATAMAPLGLLIAGPMSDLIGIRVWFWFGGAVCLLMGVGAFFVPSIMNVENNHNNQAAPEPATVG
ncbi:MAG: MFS transporter [Chloroflexi bacterium]|nr:MFS transporter [Chloroflexota bacterium]MBI3340907.1 MFS transporter [Chloroflexota bacterium]